MKKRLCLLLVLILAVGMLSGCGAAPAVDYPGSMVLATTNPVYFLCQQITDGLDSSELTVDLMVTEQVSCLHDYSLTTTQMRKLEKADLVVMNGGDLEHFMESALKSVPEDRIVDSSVGIELLPGEEPGEPDPHIWLDPERYAVQCENIASALIEAFPQHEALFRENADRCIDSLLDFKVNAKLQLASLPTRDLITFHDGFQYFAEAFDLNLLAAIEVEDGAAPSAKEINEICKLVRENNVPAIFEETFANETAHISAGTVASEAPCGLGTLNMFMGADGMGAEGSPYAYVMQYNIDMLLRYLTWE